MLFRSGDANPLGDSKWEATEISPQQAKEIIERENKQPIFIAHGWNSAIGNSMPLFDRFDNTNFYPVPVVWPYTVNYLHQQKVTALESGALLRKFFETENLDEVFPQKSLMMHSMGNHLFFNGVCSDNVNVTFDDIFMVAADVAFDIFHKDPKKHGNDKREKAKRFIGMLGDKGGKVYVLYNRDDLPLNLSSTHLANHEGRIGSTGTDCVAMPWS